MTSAQEKAIARIERLVKKNLYSDNYEIKKWEIHENEYFVALVGEWGMKDDENTLAEVFGRDSFQVFIGKRGGITYPVHKTMKNGKYKSYYKRFDGITMLQVVLDQK